MLVDADPPVAGASSQLTRARLGQDGEPGRLGLPWESIAVFLRIIPHPRTTTNPVESATAWGFVQDWLDRPQAWSPRTAEILAGLLASGVTATSFRTRNLPPSRSSMGSGGQQ